MAYNIIGQRGNETPKVLETVQNKATAENLIKEQYAVFNEGDVVQWTFKVEQVGSSVEW